MAGIPEGLLALTDTLKASDGGSKVVWLVWASF
jgi:hypothetical protein